MTHDNEPESAPDNALISNPTDARFAPQLAPAPHSSLLRIFIGDEGIRAGWSALIFIAIAVLAIIMGVGLVARGIKLTQQTMSKPGIMMLIETLEVLGVFLATFVMAMIESRNIFSYGYLGAHKARYFLGGVVSGFVALSALVGLLWRFGYLVFDGRRLGGLAALHFALIWALAFLLVGLFEESFMRGYLQFTLTRGLTFRGRLSGAGFWLSALILSAAFGAVHSGNAGESPIGLFSAAAVALVFCLSLWYTKSLWWAVGFHASWDWAESYFYGTADSGTHIQGYLLATHPVGSPILSGGATGPEGSVLIMPVLLVLALGMWFAWGRKPLDA